jgi:hypothetical protein
LISPDVGTQAVDNPHCERFIASTQEEATMSQQDTTEVPIAIGMQSVVSDDQRHVGFAFNTDKGQLAVAIPSDNLANVVTHLLQLIQQMNPMPDGAEGAEQTIDAVPLKATATDISPGTTDDEALVAVRCGPMTMVFSTERNAVVSSLEKLQTKTS